MNKFAIRLQNTQRLNNRYNLAFQQNFNTKLMLFNNVITQ